MKTIEFPTIDGMNFKSQLKEIIQSPPEGGFTIEEVRLGLKVLDKIEASHDQLELEDAEFVWVKKRSDATRWVRITPDIVSFVDAIENAAKGA